jgi:hypothetical protein
MFNLRDNSSTTKPQAVDSPTTEKADFGSDRLATIKPGRNWRDYSADDIEAATHQHGRGGLNARQALVLDVLCACEGTTSKITEVLFSNGEMPISELARLTNMSLLELLPEVVDIACRSPVNYELSDDERDPWQTPELVEDKICLFAQVCVDVRADNDLFPDKDDYDPPSKDVPRVLAVGYWAGWEDLEARCTTDDERDRLDDLIEQFRKAVAARAGIQTVES